VAVAHAVGTQIAVIGVGSGLAGVLTQVAAVRLHANGGEYAAQEHHNAATLGGPPAAMPTGDVGAASALPAPPSFPAPQSPTAPTCAKHSAQLIHGGPGPDPLRAAACRLRAHADELREAGVALRGATDTLEGSWFSAAGAAAHGRIGELADFYQRHAQTAASAAARAEAQGDNVSRARAAIPHPEEFEQVEARLQAALRANAQSKGAYTAVVAALQAQHGQLTAKTTAGYADYTSGAATALDAPLSPPPGTHPAAGPDDVIVGDGHGRHDPTVRMTGFGNGGAPLSPGVDGPRPPTPVPGGQPQIGPFPVPPQVAAAAQPPAANPNSAPDRMLLGGAQPPPGGSPLDPLYQQLIHPAAPAPPGGLTPEVIAALRAYGIDPDKLRADQQFSWGTLLSKAAEGCGVGGVTPGVWGLLGGPLDVPVIVGGCVVGGVGDAGHYAFEHGN
jgi:hypothetical protein